MVVVVCFLGETKVSHATRVLLGEIIDANNDMHREYPGSFVIPVVAK